MIALWRGGMAHGRRDQAADSLEGDMADTGTSPSWGRQSLQWTIPMNVGRRSLMHGVPSTRMEKRRRLVHATESRDKGGLSMLAGPASSPPQPSTSVVMSIAIMGSPLRPYSLADAFMVVHHRRVTTGGTLVVPPLFRPATTSALAIVHATSTNLPLVVDILSPSVATSIATPLASSADARGFAVGGVVLEGIPPPSFSLQLGTWVGSMLPTRLSSPWPEGFTLESDSFFRDITTQVRYQQVVAMELSDMRICRSGADSIGEGDRGANFCNCRSDCGAMFRSSC